MRESGYKAAMLAIREQLVAEGTIAASKKFDYVKSSMVDEISRSWPWWDEHAASEIISRAHMKVTIVVHMQGYIIDLHV